MGLRRGVGMMWVVAVSLVLAGCGSPPWVTSQPHLYSPVNGSFGVGQSGVAPGGHVSQGDIPLCIDQSGTVTITSVEPITSTNGMKVLDFAVRSIPAGDTEIGGAVGDLTSLGMTKAEEQVRQVSTVCNAQERSNVGLNPGSDTSDRTTRIDLVVTMGASALPAGISGLRIHYSVNGVEGSTESRVSFAICGEKVTDECTPPSN